ncbi:MAG: FeoC-like transcriptional regulator [Anaerolineales bacterium]|jgi:hypothetical protein
MLGRLLTLIKNNQGIISQDDLCAALDVTPDMLEGLISSLVHMGRLVEVPDNKPVSCTTCEGCSLNQQCGLLSLFQEKRYQVVDRIITSKVQTI